MSQTFKKRLKSILRTVEGDIKALKATGLFQSEWYLSRYPDAAKSGLRPLEHYVRFGEAKGYWPNPYFNPTFYAERAKGAKRFPGLLVVHYAKHGWKNGRVPSRKFSTKLYLKYNPKVAAAGIEPLADFLCHGNKDGRWPMPLQLEKEKFSDIADSMDAIAKSGLFLADWYRSSHTDLWHYHNDLLLHFVRTGANQNRWPNPYFDTGWYRVTYSQDIGDANPLAYYATKGWKEGHWPARDFSPAIYLEENTDINASKVEPLAHYLHYGLKEKRRYPKPNEESAKKGQVDKKAKLPLPDHMRSMLDFEKRPLEPKTKTFDSRQMNIHWVIPDFSPGAGGHMTIFRMAHFLEVSGHKLTIWINNPTVHATPQDAYDSIVKHFQHFAGEVKFIDDTFKDAEGDALIATDCWTVWPVLSATNFKRRFYFVQDYEPSFHPMGASYLAAEATYHEDLDCICAGPWLSKLMQEKYGRWASHFWLAADRNIYTPPAKPRNNPVPRIAFYARHFTARRAVELAMLALEELATRDIAFEVDFFGAELNLKKAPFPFRDHGVASPEELADLFRDCDLGIVFSATNYSLVPQEMMACGLPIVELKGDNTTCIFPDDTVTLAEPNPVDIAEGLQKLIEDPALRNSQAAAASSWVDQFSWPASAKLVEEALIERLNAYGKDTAGDAPRTAAPMKASVVIPTLNAGPVLDRVLAAVTTQKAPWPYEILVIDSGSTDGTLDTIAKYPSVRLHQIDKKDFNHGDTRNLGAELTSGEFIAFLTHDALPANDRWLFNLVTSIEHYPNAAGAFGKHLPWPDASPYTKRDLNAHFNMMAGLPLYLTKDTDKARFKKADPQWMQVLHFYSDNNSCMRRSAWEKIPYRRTKFGEDQLWADDIIKAGYGKVYAARAVVYHSHDFEPDENRERNMTESAFFKHFFGYELMKDEKTLRHTIKAMNAHDTEWGKAKGLPNSVIKKQHKLTEARLTGYLEGARADTSKMF